MPYLTKDNLILLIVNGRVAAVIDTATNQYCEPYQVKAVN